jgi:hypothetical protein
MNASVEQMARFVGSSGYIALPFGKQSQYMERLNQHKKELADAFKAGKITREEAQQAVNYAWFGSRLMDMRLYTSASEGAERDEYLTTVAKKEIARGQGGKKAGSAATTEPAAPADEVPAGLPKHEQSAEKEIPAVWPEDVQRQWQSFWQDVDERVAELKKEKKAASGASGGASIPKPGGKKSGSGGGAGKNAVAR